LALPRLISEAIKAAGFWAVAHSKGGRQEGAQLERLITSQTFSPKLI